MASSVNANAVLCVKGEIHNVLTVLRLNSRWASRERFTREIPLQAESPLARAFKGLHSHLEEVDDLANVDTVRYLLPFLAVVESPATTGPMTGVALSSLHKFLLYGFIRKDCPRVKEGITLVAQAISRCHFEETDPESDELVLMKLLELSALCLRCEVGDLLTDESCWNIFVACYNLYHITTDDKSFGLLRDTAGNTLAHIVLMLFSRPRVSRASKSAAPGGAATADATVAAGGAVLHETLGQKTGAEARDRPPTDQSKATPTPGGDRDGLAQGSPPPPVAAGLWRHGSSKAGDEEGNSSGGKQTPFGRGGGVPPPLEVGQEEEPWPSLDGANDDGASQGVDDGVVVAGRGALKAMMGPGNGRFGLGGVGGPVSPVQPTKHGGGRDSGTAEQEGVLVKLMRFLSLLSDPRSNGSAECVLSLSLINIALEAGGADLGRIPSLVRVMRGDLCKHLLQNSQTDDLDVLSLTLRVVFNLFNSIKDHLKVQLEVFLTSVHLRVLDGSSYGPEQQELALESLLEFTREPALMTDVYINYDCDVQCTNLFETICHSLSSHALPRDGMEVNALNRLALEGVLAVIESISRRCGPSFKPPSSSQQLGFWVQQAAAAGGGGGSSPLPLSGPHSGGLSASLGGPDSSRRSSVSDSDSDQEYIAAFGGGGAVHGRGDGGGAPFGGSGGDGGAAGELGWLERARARTAEVLQERKKMKRRLGLAARKFNTGTKGWLEYAQELGLIPTPKTAAATAAFLKGTLLLDKSMLGEYLSRGPADKYPFNAQVLEEYVKLFDMRDKTFVEALRAFLKEFRLPGEAQCIDRLMEAFAGQQYEQGKESGQHPFVNADAAFTMAFSAIMLNTDLHNPQIQDHRRMTLDDFIRNNRQINGGKDLPREFLEDMYTSIKENEIQVHRDHVAMAADGLGIDYTVHWDGILNRSNNVASASFTPAQAARKHLFPAGVHERDMLLSVTGPASDAIRAVFLRTQDDLLVLGCLRGFRSHARACVYLGLLAPFDAALVFFFQRGLEYASSAAAGAAGLPLPEVLKNPGLPDVTDMAACAPFASGCVLHRDLLALKCGLELARAYAHCVSTAWGPMLECVFALADLQALPSSLTDVDDFGDAQGNPLPPSVFAKRCRDRARSGHNVLLSQSGRVRAAAAASSGRGGGGGGGGSGSGGGGGLWGSLSGVLFSRGGEGDGGGGRRGGTAAEAAIGAIAEVVRTVQLEQLFPQTKDLPLEVVEGLLGALLTIRDPATPRRPPSNGTPTRDGSGTSGGGTASSASSSSSSTPPSMVRTISSGSGAGGGGSGGGGGAGAGEAESMAAVAAAAAAASFEAHAVLALELSSRVVLANRQRVPSLWPALHSFLARVLGGEDSVTMTRMPYLVERAMVTVLRACIHMLDREDMGAMLLQSLKLLLSLPPDVVLPLSNRLASGLLILIQANASALSLPSTAVQWEVISALMGKAVLGGGGRGFILEALAFVVNRGLGLLGRHNVVAVHALLTRFVRGDFSDGKADFAWTLQACAALEAMTFALLRDLHTSPSPSAAAAAAAAATVAVPHDINNKDGDGAAKKLPQRQWTIVDDAAAGGGVDEGGGVGAGGTGGAGAPGTESVGDDGAADTAGSILSRYEAEGMWLSTLQTLGALAGSHFPKVAKGAADALERLVLELHGVGAPAWGTAFSEVLLQLPVPLLPPHFRPAAGVVVQGTWSEEVCIRCCSILSRAFLHHLQALTSLPGFGKLWLDTVTLISRNLEANGSSGADGVAAESCQQILTNMVMVVAYAGLLGGQHVLGDTGPGDASGGGGSRGGDPQRLLHETREILEPVCPGLRPLLKGLVGTGTTTPEALDSQPPPPPPAAEQPAEPPTEAPSSHEGLGGGSDVTTAAAEVEAPSFSERDADAGGADSVLDYGGDGSLAVAEARGGGDPWSSSPANDELQAADGLFEDKGVAGGGERDAAAGAREVFDRPVVQSAPAPPILSGGRPQIV